MVDLMEKKNYDLTQITRILLKMRDNCVPKDGDLYDDPERKDKYEALEATIDLIGNLSQMVTMPNWIGVEERLPPPETKIYLIASRGPDGERIVKTSVWAWDENGEKGYWINWNVVTHWMPLPEPPKEDE